MAIRLLRSVDTDQPLSNQRRDGQPLSNQRRDDQPLSNRRRDDQLASNQRAEACAFLVFRVLAETGSSVAVLHTGDTPYLEVPRGEIELSRDRLTPAAMEALAAYLLPDAALRALRADGSVQSEWRILPDLPYSRFTIVAALRNYDLWIEVRHKQAHAAPSAPVRPPIVRDDARDDDPLAVPSADELWSR